MKKYYAKNLIATIIAASFLFTTILVNAEEHLHDHGNDPLVTKVMFDQFEF